MLILRRQNQSSRTNLIQNFDYEYYTYLVNNRVLAAANFFVDMEIIHVMGF